MKKIIGFTLATLLLLSVNIVNAAEDLIGDAVAISMPFQEIVNNSGFSELLADDYCGESPVGDFFYRYTPASNQTLNIKAVSDDTEIYVYDLADVGFEDIHCQDSDNIVDPNWWTQSFPGLIAGSSCGGDCSENANVVLTSGTEYIISIASNGTDSQGSIFVSMAIGADAAQVPPGVPAAIPTMSVWGLGVLVSLLGLTGIRRRMKPSV